MAERRTGTVLFSLLLAVLLLAVPLSGVVGAQSDAPALSGSNALQEGNNTTNATTTATAPPGDTAPNSSAQSRVTPLTFDEPFLSVEVQERDSVFNTSGPFVQFSVTEPLEAVRISQQGADAELLTGQHTVMVHYSDNAAPKAGQASLYTLELFYVDGSTAEVELYARQTAVSVDAAALEDYRPFIFKVRDAAAQEGYEKNPAGVEKYWKNTKDRADLLDSLFVEQAAMAVSTAAGWIFNPVAIAITVALIALGSYYRYSRRGYVLETIANDSGRAARLRERLWLQYKKNQQTADEERLGELKPIGETSEIYWRDAQGVSTVYQLAELARSGRVVERDGDVKQVHRGLSDLDAAGLEESWLESVAGTGRGRIASYDIALSHIKKALERMMSTYGQGHIYREEYEAVVDLIAERQAYIHEGHVTASGSSSGSGSPSGGD